jgi:prephenate dehydrogenase
MPELQEVAIVGAAGKMGSWFASYFAKHGLRVSAYDINKGSLNVSNSIRIADSITDCVKEADLVLVSVPVRMTPRIIGECIRNMRAGATIAEISSVKHRTFQALKKAPTTVKPLCIHPMFGPGASERMRLKMLLVPVRNGDEEVKIMHEIFDNAMVKVLPDTKTHDRSIATVLGLTYFVNIVFAKVMASENVSVLKQVSGTTFELQSLIVESILTNEPDLIVTLIQENPFARKYIKQYLKEASIVARMASSKDSKKLKADFQKIKSKLQKWQDLQQSYRKMYDIIENLK